MIYVFLTVFLLGVAGIVVLVARRFPEISNLDVDNLPAEKEARKKKQIINKRLESESSKLKADWAKRLAPVKKGWTFIQKKFRRYVGKIELLWQYEQTSHDAKETNNKETKKESAGSKLNSLLQEAEIKLQNNKFDLAEELYIAAIKENQSSAAAYRGLADTYVAKKSFDEASQTYQFLLKLTPADDSVMVKMSELAEQKKDLGEAIKWLQQAVVVNDSVAGRFAKLAELLLKERQPKVALEAIAQACELDVKNSSYVDFLVETAILCGDSDIAGQALAKLKMLDRDNSKIALYEQKLAEQ